MRGVWLVLRLQLSTAEVIGVIEFYLCELSFKSIPDTAYDEQKIMDIDNHGCNSKQNSFDKTV